ncbi:hypothetical protein C7M84_016910, partial [Penaeus vannamei]
VFFPDTVRILVCMEDNRGNADICCNFTLAVFSFFTFSFPLHSLIPPPPPHTHTSFPFAPPPPLPLFTFIHPPFTLLPTFSSPFLSPISTLSPFPPSLQAPPESRDTDSTRRALSLLPARLLPSAPPPPQLPSLWFLLLKIHAAAAAGLTVRRNGPRKGESGRRPAVRGGFSRRGNCTRMNCVGSEGKASLERGKCSAIRRPSGRPVICPTRTPCARSLPARSRFCSGRIAILQTSLSSAFPHPRPRPRAKSPLRFLDCRPSTLFALTKNYCFPEPQLTRRSGDGSPPLPVRIPPHITSGTGCVGGGTAHQVSSPPPPRPHQQRIISHRERCFEISWEATRSVSSFYRVPCTFSLQPSLAIPRQLSRLFQRAPPAFLPSLHFACRAQRPSKVGVNEHQAPRPASRFTASPHSAQLQIPSPGLVPCKALPLMKDPRF